MEGKAEGEQGVGWLNKSDCTIEKSELRRTDTPEIEARPGFRTSSLFLTSHLLFYSTHLLAAASYKLSRYVFNGCMSPHILSLLILSHLSHHVRRSSLRTDRRFAARRAQNDD